MPQNQGQSQTSNPSQNQGQSQTSIPNPNPGQSKTSNPSQNQGQNQKKTRVHLVFGRQVTSEDLKRMQVDTDALEARLAEGDHADHEHHEHQQE